MPSETHISRHLFESSFVGLVLGRHLMPRKRRERDMLLLSTVCGLDRGRRYPEAAINAHLTSWLQRFGAQLATDHVTLRRYLVDEDILARDPSGSSYVLGSGGTAFSHDASIHALDLDALYARAVSDRAARKRTYLGGASTRGGRGPT